MFLECLVVVSTHLAETLSTLLEVGPGVGHSHDHANEVALMRQPGFRIDLPPWVAKLLGRGQQVFPTEEERMRLAIALARENVERQTGGPFGAAVFDEQGRLVAPGVNVVVTGNCSILHAEIVAIALAQKKLGRYDIGDQGRNRYALVASAEPCAMCFGAIPWSGVTRLVCGARDEDMRRIGFDEGPKLSDWQKALQKRGIRVTRDVLREEAVAVLGLYVDQGGPIYNTGRHE
jgi:tRNA(Arg) A34 adenosine deaminase TadA